MKNIQHKIPLIFHPPIIYLLGCNLFGIIIGFVWYAIETGFKGNYFLGDAMVTCRSFIVIFSVSSLMCLFVTVFLRKSVLQFKFRKKIFYYLTLSTILVGTFFVCLTLSDVMQKTYRFVSFLKDASKLKSLTVKVCFNDQNNIPTVIHSDSNNISRIKECLSKTAPFEPSHDRVGNSFFVPEEGTIEISSQDGKSMVFDWYIPYRHLSSIVIQSHEGRYAIIENNFFEVKNFE